MSVQGLHAACDALHRAADVRLGGGERKPQIPRAPESAARHGGDAELLEQDFRKACVAAHRLATPALVQDFLDASKGVISAVGLVRLDAADPAEQLNHQVAPLLELHP